MGRVFDCLTFFDELDLLEIRLNELSPVVDRFVIAESTTTFQGDPKPLYFRDNRDRFSEFQGRIHHLVVDQMPEGDKASDHWRREYHQRNSLITVLGEAEPDDMILLSDVDEIPRADAVRAAAETPETVPAVHCFELAMFTFFLNYLHEQPWSRSGPRMTQRRHLHSMQALRKVHPPVSNWFRSAARWVSASTAMRRPIRRLVHHDAGWHFSSMGGVERVAQKLSSFSHLVGDRVENPDASMVATATAHLQEARANPGLRKVPLDGSFPAYLLENRDRFAHLLDNDTASTSHDRPTPPETGLHGAQGEPAAQSLDRFSRRGDAINRSRSPAASSDRDDR